MNQINSYVPGKPIDLVKRSLGIKKVIKLASNENAFGSSPKARLAIKNNLQEIFRYPDGSCYYLKKVVAEKLKINPSGLIFGNGSDEIIDIIIKTFLNPGEEVLTADTTFVEYEIIAKANGFQARCIPLTDFRYNLNKINKSITKKTKIVFIANPNNPTGTYITNNELLNFINNIPNNIIVVVDEAYIEFVDAGNFPNSLKLINKKNIIILRTFSKAYGLAGLRIGYAISRPEFIKPMEKIRQPFNVNFLAQKAAEAAITDTSFIDKTKKLIISERNDLYKIFQKLKIEYVTSQANFIMFKTKFDGVNLCNKLLKKGIIIRDLKQYKLDKYVRVTIGTIKENKIFIRELKNII